MGIDQPALYHEPRRVRRTLSPRRIMVIRQPAALAVLPASIAIQISADGAPDRMTAGDDGEKLLEEPVSGLALSPLVACESILSRSAVVSIPLSRRYGRTGGK